MAGLVTLKKEYCVPCKLINWVTFPTCIQLFCLVCRVVRNLVDLPVALAPLVQEGDDRIEEEEEDEAEDDDLL